MPTSTLAPGLTHRSSLLVTEDLTVPQVSHRFPAFADMPPVLATALLVAFAESTCIECLAPHLGPAERTVGTRIDITHTAPTPIGRTIHATVELVERKDRALTFTVHMTDDADVVGRGTHCRAVIDLERFMAKLSSQSK